ncbi:hypothetical protein CWS33_29530, partial [Escherichia coli]
KPYSVTESAACAAPAKPASNATANSVFFIKVPKMARDKGIPQPRGGIAAACVPLRKKRAASALNLVSALEQFEVTRISKNYFPWAG